MIESCGRGTASKADLLMTRVALLPEIKRASVSTSSPGSLALGVVKKRDPGNEVASGEEAMDFKEREFSSLRVV